MSTVRYIVAFALNIELLLVLSACGIVQSAGYGPPASWKDILGAVQKEAYNVEPGATLRYVYVDIVGNPPKSFDYNRPMELRFDFIRDNGRAIQVTVGDSSPPTVLKVDSASSSGGFLPTDAEKMQFAQDLSTIKLGPRDVYQSVVAQGKDFDNAPEIGLNFPNYERYKEWAGSTIVWDVRFNDYPSKTLRLLLDASSGQILDTQKAPPYVTVTPRPAVTITVP